MSKTFYCCIQCKAHYPGQKSGEACPQGHQLKRMKYSDFAKAISPVYCFDLDGLEKFSFHADGLQEAETKVFGWLLWHGMNKERVKVAVKLADERRSQPQFIHDEWMR